MRKIFADFLIGRPSSYMTLQLLHSEFPYSVYEENLIFFLSVYLFCLFDTEGIRMADYSDVL
jgi:hypothetical protein